jgi:hypothetical protein
MSAHTSKAVREQQYSACLEGNQERAATEMTINGASYKFSHVTSRRALQSSSSSSSSSSSLSQKGRGIVWMMPEEKASKRAEDLQSHGCHHM